MQDHPSSCIYRFIFIIHPSSFIIHDERFIDHIIYSTWPVPAIDATYDMTWFYRRCQPETPWNWKHIEAEDVSRLWMWPPDSNSYHQDYETFLVGDPNLNLHLPLESCEGAISKVYWHSFMAMIISWSHFQCFHKPSLQVTMPDHAFVPG